MLAAWGRIPTRRLAPLAGTHKVHPTTPASRRPCTKQAGTHHSFASRHHAVISSNTHLSTKLLAPSPPRKDLVEWHTWDDATFQLAKEQNKMIFLSIGYSACQFCRRMAEECFSNPQIARYMNQHFINILVDRELRPDLDKAFMFFVISTTGQAGWPLSIWLTPDLTPFVGGTYFSPHRTRSSPGFLQLLSEFSGLWASKGDLIKAESAAMTKDIIQKHVAYPSTSPRVLPDISALMHETFRLFASYYDKLHGGFGIQPKFARPAVFHFLFAVHLRGPKFWKDVEGGEAESPLAMALTTMKKMGKGGINDQLGGGFHRYAVTKDWLVPRFEKMLSDQALVSVPYLQGFLLCDDDRFSAVPKSTLEWALFRLRSPTGGFCTSINSSTSLRYGDPSLVEGAYYLWRYDEVARVLPADLLDLFCFHYGIVPEGNIPPEAVQPHMAGRNIPTWTRPLIETAAHFSMSAKKVRSLLSIGRAKLLHTRQLSRPKPQVDSKVVLSSNAMMISTLAIAYQIIGDPVYLSAAEEALSFCLNHMYCQEDGKLVHSVDKYANPQRQFFCGDYAFLVAALIELYETTLNRVYLHYARELQLHQITFFWDLASAGFFETQHTNFSFSTKKDYYDGSEPSSNAQSLHNLVRLAALLPLERESFLEYARDILIELRPWVEQSPNSSPFFVAGAAMYEIAAAYLPRDPHLPEATSDRAVRHDAALPPWYTFILSRHGAEGHSSAGLLNAVQRVYYPYRTFYSYSTVDENSGTDETVPGIEHAFHAIPHGQHNCDVMHVLKNDRLVGTFDNAEHLRSFFADEVDSLVA